MLKIITPTLLSSLLFFSCACQNHDPRFDNSPVIRASDIKSSNASLHNTTRENKPTPNIKTKNSAPQRVSSNNRQAIPIPNDHPTTTSPQPNSNALVQPDANAFSFDSPQMYGKTGPLRWDVPDSWRPVKPGNSFRMAEYIIPGANGTTSAVMSVFHFPGGAGGVQANIERWIGQFTPSQGESSGKNKIQVAGLTVWRIHAGGLYNPGMAGGDSGAQEDYRLNGAIVETKEGPFFFKLVGPRPTVLAASDDFDNFVQSFHLGNP